MKNEPIVTIALCFRPGLFFIFNIKNRQLEKKRRKKKVNAIICKSKIMKT